MIPFETDDDDVYYLLYSLETKARRGDGEYGRLYEGAEGRNSRGTHGHSRAQAQAGREKG